MAVTYGGSYNFNPTMVLWYKLVILVFTKIKQGMLYYYNIKPQVHFFDEEISRNRSIYHVPWIYLKISPPENHYLSSVSLESSEKSSLGSDQSHQRKNVFCNKSSSNFATSSYAGTVFSAVSSIFHGR